MNRPYIFTAEIARPFPRGFQFSPSSAPSRRLRVTRVSDQRQQAEKCGQRVLAFSRPGDRFHVQRMQSKKRGDQRARPAGVCCSKQKPEHKQRARRNLAADRASPFKCSSVSQWASAKAHKSSLITNLFYRRQRRKRRFSSLANLQRELVIVGAFHAGQNHAGNTIFQNQLVKVNQ